MYAIIFYMKKLSLALKTMIKPCTKLIFSILSSILSFQAMAESKDCAHWWSDKAYIGIFGAAGSFKTNNITQSGTALYTPPLSVNAQGDGSSDTFGMVGIQVGYKWTNFLTQKENSAWSILPATEIEGYYINGTVNGGNLVNETDRLDLHTFSVSYPMNTGVFLLNGVFNLNNANYKKIQPYVGVGLGTAVVSIHGATSTQTNPEEPGINHYNSDSDASDWTLAFQTKAGLNFNLANNTNVFLEYRFLSLSPTDYTFGSTQYATHIPTTPWQVDMGTMYYNMAAMGIQYDL